jgi:hypothetical protein
VTEIDQNGSAIGRDNHVLWRKIAKNHISIVEVKQSTCEHCTKTLCLMFTYSLAPVQANSIQFNSISTKHVMKAVQARSIAVS